MCLINFTTMARIEAFSILMAICVMVCAPNVYMSIRLQVPFVIICIDQ